MSDNESDTEYWTPDPFMHDGVRVYPDAYAFRDHSDVTTVYEASTVGSNEVFHADKHCPHLHTSEPHTDMDGQEVRHIQARTLPRVMTSYLDPVRPCDYCTLDIESTAAVAVIHDDVSAAQLEYYSPGDKRVTTNVRRDPETGETTVTEHVTEVYE